MSNFNKEIEIMLINSKVKTIEVDNKEPHKHDRLNREKDCLFLVDIIKNSKAPYTLAIDAEWGNGKTVFMKMLKAHLEKAGFNCFEFDAWKHDFYEDPMVPLIAGISEKTHSSLKKDFREIANSLFLCFKAVAPLVDPATHAVLSGVDIVQQNLKPQLPDLIENYRNYEKALEKFKGALEKAALETGVQSGNPMVLLIDELDRCRPHFALRMLEEMKHIFDVPSLFFVIAINKRELGSVVKSSYGYDDSERYLEKFFDLVFYLRNEETLIESSLKDIDFGSFEKERESSLDEINEHDFRKWFDYYFGPLARTFGLSLRVQEKLAKIAIMVLETIDFEFAKNYSKHAESDNLSDPDAATLFRVPIICYFLTLRFANPDLFRRSIESETPESFPWEENFKCYLDRIVSTEEIGNIQFDDMKPQDRDVCFNLAAISDKFGISLLSSADAKATEKISRIRYLINIDDYSSFREFLSTIDLAGRRKEVEN